MEINDTDISPISFFEQSNLRKIQCDNQYIDYIWLAQFFTRYMQDFFADPDKYEAYPNLPPAMKNYYFSNSIINPSKPQGTLYVSSDLERNFEVTNRCPAVIISVGDMTYMPITGQFGSKITNFNTCGDDHYVLGEIVRVPIRFKCYDKDPGTSIMLAELCRTHMQGSREFFLKCTKIKSIDSAGFSKPIITDSTAAVKDMIYATVFVTNVTFIQMWRSSVESPRLAGYDIVGEFSIRDKI